VNHSNNYRVEGLKDNSNPYKNDFAANDITVITRLIKGTEGKRIEYNAEVPAEFMSHLNKGVLESHGFSQTSASILLTFANPDFPIDIASINSNTQIIESIFTISSNKLRKNNNVSKHNFFNIVKIIRLLGLMALISYMIVILFTWIFANMEGYMYFSAGEPVLYIKYPEWILGFIGIFVAVDYLHRELNKNILY
jgi:hypothetical protein